MAGLRGWGLWFWGEVCCILGGRNLRCHLKPLWGPGDVPVVEEETQRQITKVLPVVWLWFSFWSSFNRDLIVIESWFNRDLIVIESWFNRERSLPLGAPLGVPSAGEQETLGEGPWWENPPDLSYLAPGWCWQQVPTLLTPLGDEVLDGLHPSHFEVSSTTETLMGPRLHGVGDKTPWKTLKAKKKG